MNDQ
jgi:hypothetical protein